MSTVTTLIVSVVASWIAIEILGLVDVLARHIITRAARRLPEPWCDTMREDWLANLEHLHGAAMKLFWAVPIALWGVHRLNAELAGTERLTLRLSTFGRRSARRMVKGIVTMFTSPRREMAVLRFVFQVLYIAQGVWTYGTILNLFGLSGWPSGYFALAIVVMLTQYTAERLPGIFLRQLRLRRSGDIERVFGED